MSKGTVIVYSEKNENNIKATSKNKSNFINDIFTTL